MELVIFSTPNFVKEASADMLDPSQPGALVIGGYRYDNPAAAWTSEATLRKLAMEDPLFSPSFTVAQMIKQACELFNISESDFELNPDNFDHVLVKSASEVADLTIADENDYKEAAKTLLSKRANGASFTFCKECADKLLTLGESKGYFVDNNTLLGLQKLAGDLHNDNKRGAQEIYKRARFARQLGNTEAAELLDKYASACEKSNDPSIVPYIIEGLDEFDRGIEAINKSASANFSKPEDAFYLTPEEFIRKEASAELAIDKEHTVKKSLLVKKANVEEISKWASDCGFSIPEYSTPEEIVGVIKTMPASLREEFSEAFSK